MAKAIMVARTSAISQERESEFHDWYDNVHFKDPAPAIVLYEPVD